MNNIQSLVVSGKSLVNYFRHATLTTYNLKLITVFLITNCLLLTAANSQTLKSSLEVDSAHLKQIVATTLPAGAMTDLMVIIDTTTGNIRKTTIEAFKASLNLADKSWVIDAIANSGTVDACNGQTTLTDTRDGQTSTYSIRSYNAAGCWMTQNLRYFSNIGGMRINPGLVSGPALIPTSAADAHNTTANAITYYEDGAIGNVSKDAFTQKFGLLYRWDSAMLSSRLEGSQGICPAGWHIPSDAEWNILEKEIANRTTYGGVVGTWNESWATAWGWREGGQGASMKNDNLLYGQDAANAWRLNGTNAAHFNIFLAGLIGTDETGTAVCSRFGNDVGLWSSTAQTDGLSIRRGIKTDHGGVWRAGASKTDFNAIRCKKN